MHRILALLAFGLLASPAAAQVGYAYTEVPAAVPDVLIFGIATYKLCQVKTFLFATAYVLGAMGFAFFALRAIFGKFELKPFISIIGALFVIMSADLIIAFMSPDAYYCPTTFSSAIGG